MFARMRDMTADTMSNTEMFYAPDAADRVVGLFRSFGGAAADCFRGRALMRVVGLMRVWVSEERLESSRCQYW